MGKMGKMGKMARIHKKNKFRKLRLCPWSSEAKNEKESQKVNKKMGEKGENVKKKVKEKGKELEGKMWKGSWARKDLEATTFFETVPDSEDDCQMFCWAQERNRQKMVKAKKDVDERLRVWARLKVRPCTEWFPGLPEEVGKLEIQFNKKLSLHIQEKINRMRRRERLHRDRTAKAEWPELSWRRTELKGWQKHISEDPGFFEDDLSGDRL